MFAQDFDCGTIKTAILFLTFDIGEIKILNSFGDRDFKNISLDITMEKRGIFLPRHFQYFFFEGFKIGNGVHVKQFFYNPIFILGNILFW
jgi:hypothetical protein